MERGEVQLRDAVGVNCKKGATIMKIKAQVPVIWTKGCVGRLCGRNLTWHDYPSVMGRKSRGIFLSQYIQITELQITDDCHLTRVKVLPLR